ncbi:RNA polymerase I specific transcription initiation factor [Colletotrichum truncatum]|uniref:RNA polymerase I specific transcription initiation factor n=1 Tax=Colletotrichum truncatum TaxID=5467 RepID=A0ACC3YU40_COLTU|nr:RNA polymerase I specific transcription initiation factor [Colletotrichum truncatum]KAF6798608.1 RNA polymerase I specific transcription initiation factor [Colletotrichum truncatum]
MTADEEAWDLDTDEIRSIDSEELYDTRPNRWRGPRSTWRSYTQEERLLHRSMEQDRNRDLSVHLYNVFALKNRPAAATDALDVDADDAEDADKPLKDVVDKSNWRPPNMWTAWPMSTQTVPGDDFMKETHDGDDAFTVRSDAVQMPSTALEEEVTATILRQAKERFRRRQEKYERKEAARARSAQETTAASSQLVTTSDDAQDSSAEERPHAEASDEPPRMTKPAKTYEAVVSANDELSSDILRPSVRHILSTLDNTLTTLHNARLAGLSYMTDSSASATDASDVSDAASVSSVASRASSGRRGKKGRPRSKAPRTPEPERDTSQRRGRPRKAMTPLPGETEKDMKIRIARHQKRRIPYPSDEEEEEDNYDDTGAETSPTKSPRRRRDLSPHARMEARTKSHEGVLGRWGLRDWSDVIGAASLSGFNPEVVARAAQRCADLFGQGMDMQTLHEGPALKGPKAQRIRYLPGSRRGHEQPLSSSSDEEEEDDDDDSVAKRRVKRQRGSRGRRDSVPPSDSDAAARGRTSRPTSRGRSTSRSSSVGLFFCPVAGCERALEGFGRRANLQRHVARVHPGQEVDVGDVESENEMFGAVHVDGFLKPIRARKGWRAEDTGQRKRKRHYRGRRLASGDEGTTTQGEETVWDST